MPLISIPAKAKNRYLEMCKKYNSEKDPKIRERINIEAQGYKEAIKDICGDLTLGSILIDADLELPKDNRPACGGMYLDL